MLLPVEETVDRLKLMLVLAAGGSPEVAYTVAQKSSSSSSSSMCTVFYPPLPCTSMRRYFVCKRQTPQKKEAQLLTKSTKNKFVNMQLQKHKSPKLSIDAEWQDDMELHFIGSQFIWQTTSLSKKYIKYYWGLQCCGQPMDASMRDNVQLRGCKTDISKAYEARSSSMHLGDPINY